MSAPNPRDDLFNSLITFSEDIQSFIRQPPLAGAQATVAHRDMLAAGQVIMFHTARSFRTFAAITHLARLGFPDDATVLLRSLIEVAVECRFFAKRPQDAAMYLEYGRLTEKRTMNLLR